MTTDLARITDFPNPNDISVVSTEPCVEQAIRSIDSTSVITAKLPFPNCLPPELLAIIFLEYVQQSSLCTTMVPSWVTVSYVCQYWRNVALGCANLWTRLFFVSPEWMDELLKRSKAAPLFIQVDFSSLLFPLIVLQGVRFSDCVELN